MPLQYPHLFTGERITPLVISNEALTVKWKEIKFLKLEMLLGQWTSLYIKVSRKYYHFSLLFARLQEVDSLGAEYSCMDHQEQVLTGTEFY